MNEVKYLPSELYSFANIGSSRSFDYLDAGRFSNDPSLGANIKVNVLVKWLNQSEHDGNLRAIGINKMDSFKGYSSLTKNHNLHKYYGGVVIRTSLGENNLLLEDSEAVYPVMQPTGIDSQPDGLTAFACANEILVAQNGDLDKVTKAFRNPLFARLHSVSFSEDGRKLVTASSALDMVYELDMEDGSIVWSMDLWKDTPFNTNRLAQAFYRKQPNSIEGKVVHNPSSYDLREDIRLRGASCVIDDPTVYGGLGLATVLTPVFPNSVSYDEKGRLLVTSFSRGEAWRVDRDAQRVEVVVGNLGHPHGFHRKKDGGGYFVTDTVGEGVLFFNDEMHREFVVGFSSVGGQRFGLERARWLQYTTELAPDLYCAVATTRNRIILFDPKRETKRDVFCNPEWGIQMVAPALTKL